MVVCSLGGQAFMKEKLGLVKDLWTAGISAAVLHDIYQVSVYIPLIDSTFCLLTCCSVSSCLPSVHDVYQCINLLCT